jgi:hypothetical protein
VVKNDRGTGAAKLLAIAAVSGGVGGVILASRQQPPTDVDDLVDPLQIVRPAKKKSGEDPMAPDPALLRAVPPYPGAVPRRLIDSGPNSSGHMQVAWFETNDSSSDVLNFYDREFHRLNLRSMTGNFSDTMGYTGWMEESRDGGSDTVHMISVMKQSSRTMVLISESSPDEIMAAASEMPGGLRMPPQANRPRSLRMGIGESDSQLFYSRATNTTAADVARFFEQQFKERGYELVPSEGTGNVAARQGRLNIVVQARDETDRVNITVTYSQQPSPGIAP